jgi:hypothetical protein
MSKTQNIHQKKCIPKNCHWYQYMVSSSSQALSISAVAAWSLAKISLGARPPPYVQELRAIARDSP